MAVSSSTVRGAGPSKNPKVYNIVSPGTANTEFSQALDDTTKQFVIKCRGKGKLKIAFVSGETTTNFITIEKYASLSQMQLDTTGVVLYLSCDLASETIEILQWT